MFPVLHSRLSIPILHSARCLQRLNSPAFGAGHSVPRFEGRIPPSAPLKYFNLEPRPVLFLLMLTADINDHATDLSCGFSATVLRNFAICLPF